MKVTNKEYKIKKRKKDGKMSMLVLHTYIFGKTRIEMK